MLTYIGFAECGAIVGNCSTLDGTFILLRFRLRLMQQNEMMMRARTTPAAAMPPMAEVLRLMPSSELEEGLLSVGQGVSMQLVVLEVGMEGV